jgi:hypothetical protein
MAQYSFTPNNGEIAVLVDSGSDSDDTTHVLGSLDDTFQCCVKEHVPCMHSDSVVDKTHSEVLPVYTGLDPLHATATTPPQNIENSEKDELVRKEVLHTCSQLLAMLEDVKLSVLHLQYSLHAGELGPSQVGATDRSSRLWEWSTLPPLGDNLYNEISDESVLSPDTLANIQVFGVTPIETPLDADLDQRKDPHVDTNFDDVGGDSELYDGAAAKGCF